MLRHDLEGAQKHLNVAEIKHFLKGELAKITLNRSKRLMASYYKSLLLPRVAQAVIKLRGQLLCYMGPG